MVFVRFRRGRLCDTGLTGGRKICPLSVWNVYWQRFSTVTLRLRQKDRIGKLAYRFRELLHEATADLIARLALRDGPLSASSGRGAKLILILPEVDESSGLDKASLAVVGRNLINDMSNSLSNRLGIVISETVIRAAGHAGVGSAVADCLMEPSKDRDNLIVFCLGGGGMFPMGSTIRLLLNEANPLSVANSTSSKLHPVSVDVL